MNIVMGLDPGPESSAIVAWDGQRVLYSWFLPNLEMRNLILGVRNSGDSGIKPHLAIETMVSYGSAVGKETFDTCIWIGRFLEMYGSEDVTLVTRIAVKMNLCQTTRATDANVRYAIVDRFGGKVAAIGKKRTPGPLYGVSGHGWSALAIALTSQDQKSNIGIAG